MSNIIRGFRVNTSNKPSSQSNTDSYHNNNNKKKVIKSTGKFTKSQKLKLVKFPWYSVVCLDIMQAVID